MWFLTHEGIDRYNGKQYRHYSLTANGKLLNFFPNLNTLQIDTAGVVWEIGKTGHLFKYNSLQDKFELVCDFASKDKSNSGLPLTASFLDSKDNNILLCTKNKQFWKAHLLTEMILSGKVTVSTPKQPPKAFSSIDVTLYVFE